MLSPPNFLFLDPPLPTYPHIYKINSNTIINYKLATILYGEDKRGERREADYRFVASCGMNSKTLCVHNMWDQLLMSSIYLKLTIIWIGY